MPSNMLFNFFNFIAAYEYDDSQYILDFLTQKKKTDLEENEDIDEELIDDEELTEFFQRYPLTNSEELPKVEERILYYLSGHAIFSTIKKKLKHCPNCLSLAITKGYNIDIGKKH